MHTSIHAGHTGGIVLADYIGFRAFESCKKDHCKPIENRLVIPQSIIPNNVITTAKREPLQHLADYEINERTRKHNQFIRQHYDKCSCWFWQDYHYH